MKGEGAVFLADLRAALDLSAENAAAALWELAMAGLATNDSLSALRDLLQYGGPAEHERKPLSSLENELAERLAQQRAQRGTRPGAFSGRPTFGGAVQRPEHSRLTAAKRRVAERLEQQASVAAPPQEEGRWTLVHRFGVLGKPPTPAETAARQARQLLARHGVVTHTSLDSELGSWDWSIIYPELQRLELRGEVRRGYFVQGLPGVQFALPEVVEQLRAGAAHPGHDDDPPTVLNACDPANLYGPAGEWQTANGEPFAFSRIPSTWLVQQAGRPLLLIRDSGADLATVAGAGEGAIRQALSAWLAHAATFSARVNTTTWNDEPVQGSAGQPLLEAAGFYRDYLAMTWERTR